MKVNGAGADSGLSLILNVQQYEYFGIQAISAGLKIRVHRQNTLPIVGRLGFSVGPGTSVFAGIRKKRVSYIRKESGLCKYHNRSNRMGPFPIVLGNFWVSFDVWSILKFRPYLRATP